MKTRKIGILMTIAVTLILLSVVSSASARPPADDPPIPQGAAGVAAVVSPLLQYQGRLTDPSTGEPVADASYSTTFSLYDIDAGGTALWTETQAVQVQGGLFSVALGTSTVLDHGLFNGQGLWLGIAVGGDPEATPRQQIVPVAYAMSLVPGATVIDDVNDQPALMLEHTGDGNALRGTSYSTNPNRSAILGISQGQGSAVSGLAFSGASGAVVGHHDGTGPGVVGEGTTGAGGYFTSTATYGVQAETAATGAGQAAVFGEAGGLGTNLNAEAGVLGKSADGYGVAGVSQDRYGVIGFSHNSHGVRAETLSDLAAIYGYNFGGGYGGRFRGSSGVLAEATATSGTAYGVYGEIDLHVGYGGYFTNTSGYGLFGGHSHPSLTAPAIYGKNTGSGIGVYGSSTTSYGVYGTTSSPTSYGVYYAGGLAGTGTKSAIVETQDYGWRHLYAVESPGNWFEDFGTAELVDGQATVTIEPIFAQTVNLTETYHVFLTPLGETPALLYVQEKTDTAFTVRGITLDGSPAAGGFDYRIVVRRLGYEDLRLGPADPPPDGDG